MHSQPAADGRVGVVIVQKEEPRMVAAKFLVDTDHPDYGHIEEGEVLEVTNEYLAHYVQLGFAEATDEQPTRDPIEPS